MPWSDDDQKNLQLQFLAVYTYFDQQVPSPILRLYVQDVMKSGLSPNQALAALDGLRLETDRRRAPRSNEVIGYAKKRTSSREQCTQIAGRIWASLSRFGYTNAARAREYIGEDGWAAVEAIGGWFDMCSGSMTDEKSNFIAQMRDMLVGQFQREQYEERLSLIDDAPRGYLLDDGKVKGAHG